MSNTREDTLVRRRVDTANVGCGCWQDDEEHTEI
jgi:hypothetical protein